MKQGGASSQERGSKKRSELEDKFICVTAGEAPESLLWNFPERAYLKGGPVSAPPMAAGVPHPRAKVTAYSILAPATVAGGCPETRPDYTNQCTKGRAGRIEQELGRIYTRMTLS